MRVTCAFGVKCHLRGSVKWRTIVRLKVLFNTLTRWLLSKRRDTYPAVALILRDSMLIAKISRATTSFSMPSITQMYKSKFAESYGNRFPCFSSVNYTCTYTRLKPQKSVKILALWKECNVREDLL